MRHLDFSGVGVYHCATCGVLWSHPRPSRAQLHSYYAAGRYPVPADSQSARVTEKRAEAAGQFAFVAREMPRVADLDVLEIGCGAGFLLEEFHRRGARCRGVELDPASVEYARKTLTLDVRQGDVGTATRDRGRYDLILLAHVFEHLPEPREALRLLGGALRPGGALFIEVPREDVRVFQLKSAHGYRYCANHLFFYGPQALRDVATRAGFEIRRMSFTGPLLTAFYPEKPPSRGVRRLLDTPFGRPVKRWLRPLYRASVRPGPAPERVVWDWNESHASEDPGAKNIRALLMRSRGV